MEPMFVEKNATAKSRNYQKEGKSSPTLKLREELAIWHEINMKQSPGRVHNKKHSITKGSFFPQLFNLLKI